MTRTVLLAALVLGCSGNPPAATPPPAPTAIDAGPELSPTADAATARPADAAPVADTGQPLGPVRPALCEGDADRVVEVDVNGDGQPDVWKRMRRRADGREVMACKMADLNFDGVEDMATLYDVDRSVRIAELFDLDFDGRVDQKTVYDPATGRVVEILRDLDGDGDWDTEPAP